MMFSRVSACRVLGKSQRWPLSARALGSGVTRGRDNQSVYPLGQIVPGGGWGGIPTTPSNIAHASSANFRSSVRAYNSFVGGDGVEGEASKDADGNTPKKKECCPTHAAEGVKKKKEIPAVLTEEDEDSDDTFDITQHPIWNKEPIDYLLANNRRWVAQKKAEDPDFFTKLGQVHKPEFLFIGCSDARLSVQHMLGLEAGELFVHRNIANMVMNTDLNLLSVLTYAVEYLKVKNIIVCGHYDCGGVRAAMKNHDHGLIENWVMGVRDVARYHRKELRQLDDNELMHRRLVELNVQEQCIKLYANPVVQKSQAQNGFPYVHAFVYDVSKGFVKELDVDFKPIIRKYRHVYSMYDFKIPPPNAQSKE